MKLNRGRNDRFTWCACVIFAEKWPTIPRVYFRKLDKGGGGGQPHIREILGGNMKTHLAVYEEGLFDLRGAKLFKGGGGEMPPLVPTQRKP